MFFFHGEETTIPRDSGGVGVGEMKLCDSGRPSLVAVAVAGLPQGAWSFLQGVSGDYAAH